MKTFANRVLLVCGLAVAASIALAQDSEPFDPMTHAQKGPMHDVLTKFIGEWNVDVSFRMGEIEGKSQARCHAEMLFDGMFLSRKYESELMGQPFRVEQTIGYDTLRKEFFEWQLETGNTGRLETKGQWDDATKTMTCTGESFDPMTMKPAKLKTITRIDSEDQFTIEWWMVDAEGIESQAVTLIHKRATT